MNVVKRTTEFTLKEQFTFVNSPINCTLYLRTHCIYQLALTMLVDVFLNFSGRLTSELKGQF